MWNNKGYKRLLWSRFEIRKKEAKKEQSCIYIYYIYIKLHVAFKERLKRNNKKKI